MNAMKMVWPTNADGHGIVPDGFELKIAGDAQFPCTDFVIWPSRLRCFPQGR